MAREMGKQELLVQVARLYYEYDLNQNDISKKVNLSRSYVSKLLTEARESGIVKIKIIDPIQEETALERSVREHFHLQKAIIVPDGQKMEQRYKVFSAAADYLESIIDDEDILGYVWGETIYECASIMRQMDGLGGVTTVQMCGGVTNTSQRVFVSEISQLFSRKLNSFGYELPFPAVTSMKSVKNSIENEPSLRKIYELAEKANIMLMTTGGWHDRTTLIRSGYLTDDEIRHLNEKGAVGDIAAHFIDAKGNVCDPDLDERTVSVPLDTIKNCPIRIGVVAGTDKAKSTLGALRGGIFSVLITHESMIEEIQKLDPSVRSARNKDKYSGKDS
ncbi:MAG: sugar-binding transcriptional regulator [Eubacterium sp.]|nr:sugar-binding transcriptional regulator [Eubacterium sp.]